MALKLDTESQGEILKRETARKTKNNFKFGTIAVGALFAVLSMVNVGGIISASDEASKIAQMNETSNNQLITMKNILSQCEAQKEASTEESSEESNTGSTLSENTVDKNMYSAQEQGDRVAQLQMANYKNELLLDADKQELTRLVGDISVWYGAKMDAKQSPIEWVFLTDYDHTEKAYDVIWGCYTETGKYKTRYLLCLVFGTYDGAEDDFTITGKYYTDFGAMYEAYGEIESASLNTDDEDRTGQDVQDMIDQLSGEDMTEELSEDITEDTTEDITEDTFENITEESNNYDPEDVPTA